MSDLEECNHRGDAGEWGSIRGIPPTSELAPGSSMALLPPCLEIAIGRLPLEPDTSYVAANAPPSPALPPIDLHPPPLRYPETIGTLIEIRDTADKGLGVFALVDIPPGTILLSEAPLVTLIDTGTRADPFDVTIATLSPAQSASFLSLSHYSRNPNESLHRSIVYSNGYSIMKDMATGIFATASRINHSCVPNSAYVWKERAGRMVFWNRSKLLEGEEVTVNYGHKPNQLKRIYGFECQCGRCTDPGSEVLSILSLEDGEEVSGVDKKVKETLPKAVDAEVRSDKVDFREWRKRVLKGAKQ